MIDIDFRTENAPVAPATGAFVVGGRPSVVDYGDGIHRPAALPDERLPMCQRHSRFEALLRCRPLHACLAVVALFAIGCGDEPETVGDPRPVTPPVDEPPAEDPYNDPYGEYSGFDLENITFANVAPANAKPGDGLVELLFVDRDGAETRVRDYAGDKHVVVLVMRGNTNPICPFCCTQTANYVKQYAEVTKRNAEVLVVYPVALAAHKTALDPFLAKAKERLDNPDQPIPFPVVFDVELKAVNELGIRSDLSKPATYVVDREGHVRYAYVGRNRTDRPSVQAVLAELDRLDDGSSPTSEDP